MITAVTVIAESYRYRKLYRVTVNTECSGTTAPYVLGLGLGLVFPNRRRSWSILSTLMRPDSVAFGIADDPGLRYSLHFASCRQLPSPVYFTAVYSERTPATTYLSNAFRALFVDRVADEDHFASSFRNLRSVPEFWSVRPCVYFPSV